MCMARAILKHSKILVMDEVCAGDYFSLPIRAEFDSLFVRQLQGKVQYLGC